MYINSRPVCEYYFIGLVQGSNIHKQRTSCSQPREMWTAEREGGDRLFAGVNCAGHRRGRHSYICSQCAKREDPTRNNRIIAFGNAIIVVIETLESSQIRKNRLPRFKTEMASSPQPPEMSPRNMLLECVDHGEFKNI